MRTLFCCLCTVSLLFVGCSTKPGKQVKESVSVQELEPEVVMKVKQLEPLQEGTTLLADNIFEEIIHLTGTQKILDGPIFKVTEPEMLIKGDYFLMQNAFSHDSIFLLFKLPEFEFVKHFGVRGDAPGQFNFPHLAPTTQADKLAYVYETHNPQLYSVAYDGTLAHVPMSFPIIKGAVHSNKELYVADSAYYYVDNIRQGKALFKSVQYPDSVSLEQMYKLSFSPKHKNWAAYIGDFIVHPSGKRIAYAYKYFKRFIIYDMETGASRVVEFDKDGVKEGNDIVTLGPDNVTYYWGGSATEDYIYLTYSGRTPIEVSKAKESYIHLEQFDWNGNPVGKYKLDHWGRTIADGQNNKLYQLVYTYDDPLFVYDLP
ncbi:TolB-like 6-bladed beta-propeller domain-containing protein [Bacteroides sp. OttesenSCG-928-D19]|nr:TolB-like 6-bladed beta-propeller domain-containing protein [Bacteroides sp. OttesenSCG-928-D19]